MLFKEIKQWQLQYNNLENHKDSIVGDVCFFCIGTTKKNTPDKNEYINIEYNLPVEIAKIAKSNSVNNFIYVSSIGANTNASGLYLRNKGQAEEELKKLNESDKKNIKKMIRTLSIKDIINLITKDKEISKKEIYKFCLSLKKWKLKLLILL